MEHYQGIKGRLLSLIKGEFFKNIFTLGTGTIIAQLIPILISPVLTRLYTPDQFGLFANFLAVLALLLVFYTGKYELAIILPKAHKEAINIVILCIIIVSGFTIISLVFFLLAGKPVALFLKIPELVNWLWLIPIAAFLASIYLVINEWYIRKKNFLGLSKNKIANTSGITSGNLFYGFLHFNIGLIVGQITGQLFAVSFALIRMFKNDKGLFIFITQRKILFFAKKYFNFSKFIIPAQFINTIAGQAPIFILTSQFGILEAGLFSFTNRILGAPMNLIGNSFRDVFKQRAAIDYQNNGNCLSIYKKVTLTLFSVSFLPFVLLFLTAPFLFSFIFGHNWLQAGVYARALTLMYFISFISQPTSWVFVIAERQKLDLLWQGIFFVCTIIPLIIGVLLKNALTTIILLSIGRSIAFIIQLFMTYYLAKGGGKKQLNGRS